MTPKKSGRHLRAGDPQATASAAVLAKGEAVIVPPVPQSHGLVPFESAVKPGDHAIDVDVIFPVLHGTFGEDGTIQGLLELADIPYVGAGVLGSATGMDKDVMKKLFAAASLPIVKHVTVLRRQWEHDAKQVRKEIESKLKYPVFVKPANLGSSVGISKVRARDELAAAMTEAARFDRKIVIEEGVGGKKHKARELECAVLGNDEPRASVVGEIVPAAEFYSYNDKYIDEGSKPIIPAPISKKTAKDVQKMAVRAFQAVDCSGLARVDFLMDPKTGKVFLNEINTMPGFTQISMYPKMWEASGLKYSDLIDQLIQLALERYQDKQKNQYSRT
jgi:D-alanine-D-alanine ligase